MIFGYKQKGPAAEEAMNVFYYCTYEGKRAQGNWALHGLFFHRVRNESNPRREPGWE